VNKRFSVHYSHNRTTTHLRYTATPDHRRRQLLHSGDASNCEVLAVRTVLWCHSVTAAAAAGEGVVCRPRDARQNRSSRLRLVIVASAVPLTQPVTTATRGTARH